jgi:hypothetical protein
MTSTKVFNVTVQVYSSHILLSPSATRSHDPATLISKVNTSQVAVQNSSLVTVNALRPSPLMFCRVQKPRYF